MSVTFVRPNGDSLSLDASPSQSWDLTYSVTKHPIDSGSATTDHIQPDPIRVSMKGLVSESSLGGLERGRIQKAIRFFQEASSRAEVIEIESRHALPGLWLIESWPYEITELQRIEFSISLVQLRIATVETVLLPRVEVAETSPPVRECGLVSTQSVSSSEAEQAVAGLNYTSNEFTPLMSTPVR